jgi:acid phosphatase (class A)
MNAPSRLIRFWPLTLTVAMAAGPAAAAHEVILMRHGDKDSQRGDYNLSAIGFQRALALARLIPACFGKPSAITTFYLDPESSKNARSYQSAVPLGVATGVNIRIAKGSLSDSYGEGQGLRQAPLGPESRTVLFWEHRRMPELARGLGWAAMPPIDNNDFDQMFVFRFAAPGAVPEVTTYRQSEQFRRPCFLNATTPWSVPPSAFLTPTGSAAYGQPTPAPGGVGELNLSPLRAVVGKPPAPGSATERDDLAVLSWLQKYRTPEQVASAWLLLERNPLMFSRALGLDMGKTTPAISKGLRTFLALVDSATSEFKTSFRRLRPYQSHPELKPCLPPESGFSFPSGHATWYAAAAELLSALVPERRERLEQVGSHAGGSRTLCGVHYPSDVEAGQRLGRAAAAQLLKTSQWQAFREDPAIQAEVERIRNLPASALPELVR